MKNKNFIYRALFCLILLLAYSCAIEKYIPEGEQLYTGAILKLTSDSEFQDKKEVKSELVDLIEPNPNTEFLGMKPALFFHYKAQREKPGFLYKFLNKTFGEEPVYFSNVNPERVEELMLNRLDNKGFFYSRSNSETIAKEKFASVNYTINLPEPYVLENYNLESDSLPIYKEIEKMLPKTILKKGDRFDLDLLKAERARLNNGLKKKGFYNSQEALLIFEADTNQYRNRKFDLFLRLKKDVPSRASIPYSIDSITVYPNYSIEGDSLPLTKKNIVQVDSIDFVQNELYFKPKLLKSYLLFNVGDLYDANISKQTSNRLSALGSYKYVNIQYTELDTTAISSDRGSLAANIYLAPLTKQSIRAELQAVSKSNGFTGPGILLSHTDRNIFNGGETLSISANFSYELQLSSGSNSNLSSIAGGLSADLVIPRFIPFSPSRFKYAVPKTKISIGVDFLQRSNLFTLNSVNSSFGYTWKENQYVYHTLDPISINYSQLSNVSDEFQDILDDNAYLSQSFEQRFIAGLLYSFTYDEVSNLNKNKPIYFSTNFDLAGNLLSLASGSSNTIFGSEYAQYTKVDADLRLYLRWKKERTLVSRLYAGWGIPYGNSSTLPFVKQFYSGGPYSVRAFNIRSIGPGSFYSDSDDNTTDYYDKSGNLKLEANLEYRFPLVSYLKGAFFVDAGNVWLTGDYSSLVEDSTSSSSLLLFTDGKFDKDWLSEVAAGVGFGLRVDIQSFVIRLDLASPLRIPYLNKNERWNVPFFGNADNNMTLNFAIGYPF
ncbi:BamA/TamA family outer membrane protein [Maribacter sp. 1_MG-2023]|uniref:translocation and assembly module lipoprotein TamL n=1 Tax=Maribacter sp. 1_MG-2023 TaxID=3062677 RepID=UPI0026E1ADB7|nr:BamA/TamA family outer membrane protein [Maribacter sp. 1_MG-2023]MDO6471474.1 BamA/TamA family outer membrane protein [Maribacter sp. 1_MG-2023]